jgi:hypothetical protein
MKLDTYEVTITLTKEQLEQINKQQSIKRLNVEDVNSIEDAELVLKDCIGHVKYDSSQFCRAKDWINYQLETIIKAVNYIDNGYKLYIPDFDNSNIIKYTPFFKKTNSGWLLHCVSSHHFCSYFSVGLYFFKIN